MARLDAIATVVADMPRTLAFYRLLGFTVPTSADDDRYVSLDLGTAVRLSWSTQDAERSAGGHQRRAGRMNGVHIAVRCAGLSEVDAICQSIAGAGYTVLNQPVDEPWGARCCRILAPDGIVVDLFAPFP